jgi:hypothetical protein
MRVSAVLVSSLLLICTGLAGCLDDVGNSGNEVVGIYNVDSIGTATSSVGDVLLELTLVSSNVTIKISNGSASQQGDGYFGFGFEKQIAPNEVSNHGCIHENYDENDAMIAIRDCIIIEETNDHIWTIGETITLKENDQSSEGVCDSSCDLILTILDSESQGPDSVVHYISINTEEYSATISIN